MATVFDTLKIGNIEIKNRMAVAPTVKNLANYDGNVSTRILENYSKEADGPGLYIVSMTYTEEQGHVFKGQTGISNSIQIASMEEVANRIHKAGAKTFLQISHGGNLCVEEISGEMPVSASEIRQYPNQPVRCLTTDEVAAIAKNYGKAAARAKAAGFDGVEMHACHGSLMLQFMSPIHNQGRTDRYAKPECFLYECIEAAMKECGPDFPIGVRLTCHEFMQEDNGKPGLEFDTVKKMAVDLEKMGVAYIHASAGRIGHTGDRAFPPLYEPRGVNLRFAEELKKIVNIPVITVGRFQDPRLIKKVISEGKADVVAMCRGVIADPHIAKKIMDGQEEDVRQCMGCNWCLNRLFEQFSLECPMNPEYGREREYALQPTQTPKRIMVVGGGVAGLQAAYAAATRGHIVSLYEKTDSLGGQLGFASQFPALYTRELWNLPRWLIRQVKKLPVELHMKEEVTEELIQKENPDAIIVATGAVETKVNVPVEEGASLVYLWDYLKGNAEVGKKVVLFGSEAIEAAVSLCNEGKKVTLLQEGDDYTWAPYILPGASRREPLIRGLKKADVQFNTKVTAITKDGVEVMTENGPQTIACDTVIAAPGRTKTDALFTALKGKNREIYVIGDAREVRNMTPASHEGYWVGRTI